ncbi:MAG: tetrahydromethanopterin S-methyltransferase subunit H [Candidatus Thorarchaeota archaeon]|nr:MAG: tetrahydromethanopterin S-methyltransferase subunit H [Candidatus Thorarchaeota archaeon]
MFVFEKEQIIHNIGGVKIGGNPGETSTVLAGTIFYGGHKIVTDTKKGVFDKDAATALIQKQDEMAQLTGNPALVQIFSETEVALKNYIDFVSVLTEAPFLIDSTEPMVRVAGLIYAEEVGLLDRAIYNSLNVSATNEEIDALRTIQHECAIILAFNPQDPTIAGRRKVLESGALDLDKGLIPLSKELGITKPLIDTAVTAMGAGAGSAAAFTFVSKTVYGQPTGSGVHNAPSSWSWLRKHKKVNREGFRTADVASNLIVQMMGADFILYGPIGNAERVFPTIAMGDVFAAESSALEFGVEPSTDHPFKKLL